MDLNMKNSLQIQYLSMAAVMPSPHSARQHSAGQRRKLKNLLQKFGQVAPIIIDVNNEIVDGHAVHETLRDLGHDEIAVVIVENRSEAEIRALRLALNRVAQDAVWDDAKLSGEFDYLISVGFDLDLSGFETVEIDMVCRSTRRPPILLRRKRSMNLRRRLVRRPQSLATSSASAIT